MAYPVVVRRSAERDLAQIEDWYEAQRPGLGLEFRQTVDALFERLATAPLIYPVVHSNVRRVVLLRFPYLLYFRLDPDRVRILACLHSSRDPRLHYIRSRDLP